MLKNAVYKFSEKVPARGFFLDLLPKITYSGKHEPGKRTHLQTASVVSPRMSALRSLPDL